MKHKNKTNSETAPERFAQTAEEEALAKAFFAELNRRVALPKPEKNAFLNDFQKAYFYLTKNGASTEEALSRLDLKNIGGFYIRPSRTWYPLDNAAKIYPLSMKNGYMPIFRIAVNLKQPVAPEILQIALTFTIKRFQSFATTVKKGFFWHYLEVTKRRYVVEKENDIPCRPIYVGANGSQSFRLMYYENRISMDFFHILTDGNGALMFMKTLLKEYFRVLGIDCENGDILPANGIADAEETANEFLRIPAEGKSGGFMDKPAVQYGGRLSFIKPCRVFHLRMDAQKLHEIAREKSATITEYLLSRIFVASRHATDGIDGEFSIQVPVNMRKFFPSGTLRNFSMYCGIRMPLSEIRLPDALLPEIHRQLEEKASLSAMTAMARSTNQIVRALGFIPLFLKLPVAKRVYGFLGDRIFSNTLSNLGVVRLPETLEAQIQSMDFVLGGSIGNRASCAVVTICGVTTLSVTKNTEDASFEEALADLLQEDGLDLTIEGSLLQED